MRAMSLNPLHTEELSLPIYGVLFFPLFDICANLGFPRQRCNWKFSWLMFWYHFATRGILSRLCKRYTGVKHIVNCMPKKSINK